MPYKFETEKVKLPSGKDRRLKITDTQREEIIKLFSSGLCSQRALARDFNVSRKLISFILFPEKETVCKEQYKERRKDGRYYDKEKNTKAMKEHRRYKQNILTGKLKTTN